MLKFLVLLLSASACLSQPFTFRNQSRAQIDTLLFGKNDTNTQWNLYSGTVFNSNCWAAPLDFTGVSTNLKVTLVTRRHGITAAHVAPTFGTLVYFTGRNGQLCTSMVQQVNSSSNDLCVVSFMFDVPSWITPLPVLPVDYTNWFENGSIAWGTNSRPAEGIWLRPNTGKVNVKPIMWSGPPWMFLLSHTNWTPPAFTEGNPTNGDSGGPAFILVNGEPVFLFSTYGTPGPAGPHVSEPGHLEFIQSVCGASYPLRFVSLQRYEKP